MPEHNGFEYEIFGRQPRPWGFEVRPDVTDIAPGVDA
jgi:hypothetical protein